MIQYEQQESSYFDTMERTKADLRSLVGIDAEKLELEKQIHLLRQQTDPAFLALLASRAQKAKEATAQEQSACLKFQEEISAVQEQMKKTREIMKHESKRIEQLRIALKEVGPSACKRHSVALNDRSIWPVLAGKKHSN